MSKLVFISNKEQSYISMKRDEILEEWGSDTPISYVKSFSEVSSGNLFAEKSISIIAENGLDSFKKMVEDALKLDKNNELDEKLENGVIVATTLIRPSITKFEKLVLSKDGEVYAEKAADYSKLGPSIVNKISVSRELKNFLIDFAGDDFTKIIGIVRNIEALPKSSQRQLTMEDLFIRLPQGPGSIPPWDIEKNIHDNKPLRSIETFRRFIKTASPIPAVTLLLRSFMNMYRAASVSPSKQDAALSAAGVKGYPATLAKQRAKKYGEEKLLKVVKILSELDFQMKGGSAADQSVLVEAAIMKICFILHGK